MTDSPAALEHGDLGLDAAERTAARIDLVEGDPELMARVDEGGSFVGVHSRPVAQALTHLHPAPSDDALRGKT